MRMQDANAFQSRWESLIDLLLDESHKTALYGLLCVPRSPFLSF